MELPPEFEAAFWLEVLSRRIGSSAAVSEGHIFIRHGRPAQPGMLFLIHREIRAEDLGNVLSPSGDCAYCNLLGTGPDDPETALFRDWIRERAGDAPSLSDLLDLAPECPV